MHLLRTGILLALTTVLLATPLAAQSGMHAPVTDARIEEAIARACDTLKKMQRPDDGSWDDYPNYPGATTALAVQALLLAGEPPDSPVIQRAVVALTKTKIEKTYAIACRAMAYSLLVRHYPTLRPRLAADTAWLSRYQNRNGMWTYDPGRRKKGHEGDNSNTQFAVIGLRDASLAGIEVSQSVWQKLFKHYTKTQIHDGGWTYRPIDPKMSAEDAKGVTASVSVTAPSLASLMIVCDELVRTAGCPCASGRSGGGKLSEKSVDRGVQWLVDYFEGKLRNAGGGGKWQTYFYYGLQRAGQASGLKTFGRHDWYKRGSAAMVGQTKTSCKMTYVALQHDAKSDANKGNKKFKAPRIITETVRGKEKKYVVSPGGIVDVSLAVIFLSKGNAPVYMNKLKYGGDWNRHRRDLALITQEVTKRLERPFRWQVVDINSSEADWRKDSPLLYLGGEDDLPMTDEQKKTLKTFCMSGGTLFIESNCGNRPFTQKVRELMNELWPNYPLQPLLQTHPIYNCQLKIDAEALFEGVDDGVRTFVLFTDRDFSCAWQMRNLVKDKPKFDAAINLYAYATDKAPPPSRLVDIEKRMAERRKQMEAYKKAEAEEKALAKKERRRRKRFPKPKRVTDADLEVDIADVTPGNRKLLTVNVLEHKGNHDLGLHYELLGKIVSEFQTKIGITLAVGQPQAIEMIAPGLPDVLVVRGDQDMGLTAEQQKLLADYMTGGGFVIAEAGMGRKAFDTSFRKFIADTKGLALEELSGEAAVLTGEIDEAIEGIDVGQCSFSRTVREESPGIKIPIVFAIKAGKKTVGYYSPLDLTYSSTGQTAYGIRGYDKNSAKALLINMFLKPTKG
jgi:Domain of unknown function (DUF4159)